MAMDHEELKRNHVALLYTWLSEESINNHWETGVTAIILDYSLSKFKFSRDLKGTVTKPQCYDLNNDETEATKLVCRASNILCTPTLDMSQKTAHCVRFRIDSSSGYWCVGFTAGPTSLNQPLNEGCVCYFDNRVAINRRSLKHSRPFSRGLETGDIIIAVCDLVSGQVTFELQQTEEAFTVDWKPDQGPVSAGIYTNLSDSPGCRFTILP